MSRMADLHIDIETRQTIIDFADSVAELWVYALASWRYDCSANVLAGVDTTVFLPTPRPITFPMEIRS